MTIDETRKFFNHESEEYKNISEEKRKDKILDFNSLGLSIPYGSISESYKSPIYFINEGENTGTSFMLPGENPYEEALKLNEFFYKARCALAQEDKDINIVAAQYNACISEIISCKMNMEFKINSRSVIFDGLINLIRPYVFEEDKQVVAPHRFASRENKNIFEAILEEIPDLKNRPAGTSVDSGYNSLINYTSSLFISQDGVKYAEGEEAFKRSTEAILSYSVSLIKCFDYIITNIIMPNIYTDKFADDYIKSIGENPLHYTNGDKQAYVQSILLEQMSIDYRKLMELCEIHIMHAFSLFNKIRAYDTSIVSIRALRMNIDTLEKAKIFQNEEMERLDF